MLRFQNKMHRMRGGKDMVAASVVHLTLADEEIGMQKGQGETELDLSVAVYADDVTKRVSK